MYKLTIKLTTGYYRVYTSRDRDTLLLHQDLILKLNPDAYTKLEEVKE